MSLAKIYTVGDVVNTVLLYLQRETQSELEPNLVRNFANLAVIEVADKISVSNPDDYGKTANLSDQASSATTTIVQSATYTDLTRNVNKTAHGLVAADVGKRIAIWIGTTRAAIAEIESITDSANFVITKALGGNGTANYAVFSAHSGVNLDISTLKIMNIVKLKSSIQGEVRKLGDVEFDNIERSDFRKKRISWYMHGEIIFLFIPDGESAGDLTLFYNTYPEKKTLNSEYFDIRDNYIPLVIQKTIKYSLEHLGLSVPQSLAQVLDSKEDKSKADNTDRRKSVALENRAGIDG